LALLGVVDGMTTSTDYLKKVYQKENRRRYVCPNSLDMKWRDKYLDSTPIIKKKKDEIRIGWAGSAAHYENLKQIQRPLLEILRKYPNVTFHYTGLFGGLFNYGEFSNRIKTVKFADLKKWPEKLARMGLDIALAPLADNHFNRAKSNLRVLEYWACKYPTIASAVLPYRFIKNKKDGLLVMEEKDWFDAMEKLILDEKYRKELGESGYERVKEDFNVEKNCTIWYEALHKFVK